MSTLITREEALRISSDTLRTAERERTEASAIEIESHGKRVHRLKVWPEYFQALNDLKKNFEVRKNDRDYRVGDCLILQEWDPVTELYSGDWIEAEVSYILHGGQFGIAEGYCVMAMA